MAQLCVGVTQAAKGYYGEVGGEAAKLLAGGLELFPGPKARSAGRCAGSFRAERTASSGTCACAGKALRRCVFNVEYTTDAAGHKDWQPHTTCTAARCELQGLEPGRLYWFRVAAVNTTEPALGLSRSLLAAG